MTIPELIADLRAKLAQPCGCVGTEIYQWALDHPAPEKVPA